MGHTQEQKPMGVGSVAGEAVGTAMTKASPTSAAIWLLSAIVIGCLILFGVMLKVNAEKVVVGADRWTGSDMRNYVMEEEAKRGARWDMLYKRLEALSGGVRAELASHAAVGAHHEADTRIHLLEQKLDRMVEDMREIRRLVELLKEEQHRLRVVEENK